MEHHHESFFADPRTWVGVAFVIFFVIFGKKIYTALVGIIDKRAHDIRAELDEAARLRREAESLLADAKKQREDALKEAALMLERARDEARRVAEAAHTEAAAATARRERMAMDRISAAEKAAVTEVRVAAVDVATKAAEAVIAQTLGAEADAALVDRAIQALPSVLSGRRAA